MIILTAAVKNYNRNTSSDNNDNDSNNQHNRFLLVDKE